MKEPFIEDDVFATLKEFNGDKAPHGFLAELLGFCKVRSDELL